MAILGAVISWKSIVQIDHRHLQPQLPPLCQALPATRVSQFQICTPYISALRQGKCNTYGAHTEWTNRTCKPCRYNLCTNGSARVSKQSPQHQLLFGTNISTNCIMHDPHPTKHPQSCSQVVLYSLTQLCTYVPTKEGSASGAHPACGHPPHQMHSCAIRPTARLCLHTVNARLCHHTKCNTPLHGRASTRTASTTHAWLSHHCLCCHGQCVSVHTAHKHSPASTGISCQCYWRAVSCLNCRPFLICGR